MDTIRSWTRVPVLRTIYAVDVIRHIRQAESVHEITGGDSMPQSKNRYVRIHLTLAIVWALLLVPTLLWWKDSILWVATMSLYANIAAHASAYQASRSERAQNESNGSGQCPCCEATPSEAPHADTPVESGRESRQNEQNGSDQE